MTEENYTNEENQEERPSHPIMDSLEKDIRFYNNAIKEVAEEILENNISAYPVFIAHELELTIGELILDKNDFGTHWSISASTLENLVETGIIQENKQDHFKEVYKDPKKYICIFLISEKGGNFVFYPYEESQKEAGG